MKVYTSDLKTEMSEGTDANVYIYLIGEETETEKFFLNKSKVVSGTDNGLFETGNVDEFRINSRNIGSLKRIRIGHDNSGFAAGWNLEKVEIINKNTSEFHEFLCNEWSVWQIFATTFLD